MKVFVSFRDACWNPRSSQSSFTEGTLLSGIEGFDDDVMMRKALAKRAGLFEHRNKDERTKDGKTKVRRVCQQQEGRKCKNLWWRRRAG